MGDNQFEPVNRLDHRWPVVPGQLLLAKDRSSSSLGSDSLPALCSRTLFIRQLRALFLSQKNKTTQTLLATSPECIVLPSTH